MSNPLVDYPVPQARFNIIRRAGRKSERRAKALRHAAHRAEYALGEILRNESTDHDRDLIKAVRTILHEALNWDNQRQDKS